MKSYQFLTTGLLMLMSVCIYAQSRLNTNSIKANQSKFTDSMKIGRFHVRFTNQFDDILKMETKEGLSWLDSLMSTEIFRQKVERLKYKNSKLKNKVNRKCHAETRTKKRYNGKEIYQLLLMGNDGLGSDNDRTIDLFIDLDPELSGNVLGSTSCGIITSGQKFFNDKGSKRYASHLLHEYMHVLGFNHFLNNPLARSFFLKKNDPAYQIGKLTKGFIKKVNSEN